ncbi:MAG: glutamate-1-semialdehyde 2,1-aminomutase [Halioglobus sp.]|nr:glutamate-1-semialdehyde 2,1-aminomutase [Halioglobus sp.]|tara:strand:- start:5037 stop:6761 length:1725 start_codon:yes stop_codon:yes gene_type:complete
MNEALLLLAPATAVGVIGLLRLHTRLRLSLAKHPSIRGHAKWSRRLARQVAPYHFDREKFLASDGAPADVAARRQQGLQALSARTRQQAAQGQACYQRLSGQVSDAQFTSAYRVPFPYREQLPEELKRGAIAVASDNLRVCDLDGTWRYDCSGSYGVNVFGYDFYKSCIEEATRLAGELGPVLGPYHPLIEDVAARLCSISRLDEVSFHMSGTEAVMQAVRLARYHTGRTHLVRLCGAYHGWWDGVQPGVGNQRAVNDVYTLGDLSERTLYVLETRRDIACVLINPLQALHPNADAPGDATLLSSKRSAAFDRERYSAWLGRIRDVCTRRGIVLIFDEVFTGFRLGYRGAMEYYGVQADMVTYGKTLGGGLPVGVLCGRHGLMKRYRERQPANISFARGTFNSHPYVLAAMHVFLTRIESQPYQSLYANADRVWNERVALLNRRLESAQLPLRVANLHSILTVLYTRPSRYNWMFQFYLRDAGLELGWTGSGRLIMSLAYTDADFEQVCQCFIAAARQMEADGWWWQSRQLREQDIRRQLLKEMLGAKLRSLLPAPSPDNKATTMASASAEEAR